jgi:hypothetical protein
MEFKQSTFGEIIESERLMVLTAPERFGAFYENALATSNLLQHGITGVPLNRSFFAMLGSQIKIHHTLALFSFVRLHQIQGLMNLRQVLEAAADAAYAIAHEDDITHFARVDENGILHPSQALKTKRYKWLEAYYKAGSDSIKLLKDSINEYGSHTNIVQAYNNYRAKFDSPEPFYATSFFDNEDAYHVKTDLWRAANIALCVMDLFFGVNRSAKPPLTFVPDFDQRHAMLG